jgi:hypothetical protein
VGMHIKYKNLSKHASRLCRPTSKSSYRCESTSSLTIEFSEHDKMIQEVQGIYYSYFHVDVKTCYV